MDFLIAGPCLVLLVTIAILWMECPLFMTISGDLVAALVLYDTPVTDAVVIMGRSMASGDTITVVLSFYFITFLQWMLECQGRPKQAEESLNGLFNNRRINVSAASAVIGLPPSIGAMNLCAEAVKSPCGDHTSREGMMTATNFFRHISGCFLPAYSPILIVLAVSGIGAGESAMITIPLVAMLFLIGYVFYLRELPETTGHAPKGGRTESVETLVRSLWPILLTVVLITAADIPMYAATPLAAVFNVLVDHLGVEEIRPMFRSTFKSIIISDTILIMVFKDIITSTGAIHELPAFFEGLPIPMSLVSALISFLGSIISGVNAIIPLCMSMAMVAVPQEGVPLLMLFISSSYTAMQISPTHVCLPVAAEYSKINIDELVKRNIPIILPFFAAALEYTAVLGVFQGERSKKYKKFFDRAFLHVYDDMTYLNTQCFRAQKVDIQQPQTIP